MGEIRVAKVLSDARDRMAQVEHGEKFLPVLTAVLAVLAAIATLFSNHSSVTGLRANTQAGILMTRAADSYSNYEARRVKVEINQALLGSGLIANAAVKNRIQQRVSAEDSQARNIALKRAQSYENGADDQLERAETTMRSYENFEVSATLFEVAIVVISVTALMGGAKPLFYVGGISALIALGFFISGALMH